VQARFTTRELRELEDLADADVLVDPADLELDDYSSEQLPELPAARRNLEVLQRWAGQSPRGRARRVHLHFRTQPVEVLGAAGSVTGVRLERTRVDRAGVATGTGETTELAAGLVVRAVGYRSLPLPGLPFDERAGVVPHIEGRVVSAGAPVRGTYVAGWAKRGPTGVIGTNKHDARETVRALLADRQELGSLPDRDPAGIDRLLADRRVEVVDWAGWCRIDAAERARGAAQGRARVKIADRAELLRIATAAS
jgi:ferredoxin--NADP+ reductase